jgi:hypothetical protein
LRIATLRKKGDRGKNEKKEQNVGGFHGDTLTFVCEKSHKKGAKELNKKSPKGA